jgi:outer membrane lipoprotein-sorting protein
MIHPMKQYSRTKLPADQLSQMREGIRARIREILSLEHEKLGSRTIDGIEAEGIKVTDVKLVEANFPVDEVLAYLWVDVETALPVMMEVEVIGKGGSFKSKSVTDQFEWNVELEAGFFEPVIPEDYTLSER